MTAFNLLLLPGDGIGPEVTAQLKRMIDWFDAQGIVRFETYEDLVGGAAYDAHGEAISTAALDRARIVDAVFLGAVGGPKWEGVEYDRRPEAGLLRLRKALGLFANLRPATCHHGLADASCLKRECVEGLDLVIVRELTGGVYFGEPKRLVNVGQGRKRAIDTQLYETHEIERIARVAFELARTRRRAVVSVDKRNAMKTGVLWREVVSYLHARSYSDVTLEHMLADSCAMQLVRRPGQFDVIVTDNLFGDILSDIAGALTGSLGMLPSASLGEVDAQTGRRKALYEPVHGSAPDIAGQNRANPIAMIASFAMALRYSFGLGEWADRLDSTISEVLEQGLRTADIMQDGMRAVSTAQMGEAILDALQRKAV